MRNHWFLMISIGCGHISNPLENKSNSSTQQLLIPQKNAILVYYQEHWWSYDMIQRLIFEAKRILENHCHENYWRVKCYIVSYIISYGTAVPIVLHPLRKVAVDPILSHIFLLVITTLFPIHITTVM